MKVCVCGSRNITDYNTVERVINKHYPNDSSPKWWDVEFVLGGADGVDSLAEQFADNYEQDVTLFDPYNAENTATEYSYKKHLNSAFLKRNEEMAEYADMCIAVWDGESNGTRHMIEQALDNGIDTYVEIV